MIYTKNAFTLIELLITLAVSAILITLTCISYRYFIDKNFSDTAIDQLRLAISYARHQAILSNKEVTLCPSRDQNTCAENWSEGQILLIEQKVIKVFNPLGHSITCRFKSSFAKNNRLIFQSDGTTKGQQGRFECRDNKNRLLAKLIITHSGRVRQ